MQPQVTILKPNYQNYESANDVLEAFYNGFWFSQPMPNGDMPYVTVDDFQHGDLVKVEYCKLVGDFNFGDYHTIDRTYSVTFAVDKFQ